MPIKQVTSGQAIEPEVKARPWNDFVRTANAVQLADLNSQTIINEVPREVPATSVKAEVSGNVEYRQALGLVNPSLLPTDREWRGRMLFAPSSPLRGQFAMTRREARAGDYAEADAGGIVQCKLQVDTNGEWIDRADIDPTDATRLRAVPNGSAQILWKDTGTGVKDAIVRIGNPDYVVVVGKSVGTITAGSSTGQMEVWNNTTTQTGYIIGTGGTLDEPIYLDWMAGGLDISADKEIAIVWFPHEGLWRVMHAECEDTGGGAVLPMSWNGEYQSGQFAVSALAGPPYEPGWVMQDEGFLMVANKQTSDRPAPQPRTQPVWTLPDSGLVSSGQTGSEDIYHVGNRFTFNESLWVDGWRVWVPGQDAGAQIQFQVLSLANRGTPREHLSFTAWYDQTPQGYSTIPVGRVIAVAGDTLEVWLSMRSVATPSQFTGVWQYERKNGNADAGKVWHQSGGGGNEIRFNEEDDAGTDRSSDLATIGIGSTISIPGYTWTVTSTSTSGDNFIFGVTPAVRAPEDDYLFTFVTYTAGDITYDFTTNYWVANQPAFGTAEGAETALDPIDNPPTWGNNAYSGDIQFALAAVSPDWDYMSYDGL